MPTELFIRRPLLWLTFAARKRATHPCSPNFGYRHYLKVLGDRAVDELDLSAVRLIFNGAEPISVELCEEFMARLAPREAAAQCDVPGVRAGGSHARRELPAARRADAARSVAQPPRARRRRTAQVVAASASTRCAVDSWRVGKPIPYCQRAHRRR